MNEVPVADADLVPPTLASKLRVPLTPPHHVHRQRLIDLLDDGVRAPLALVVAPAGAGKTVLLASWAVEATMPVAWFCVDESDADVTAFWTGVIAALGTIVPGVGPACRTAHPSGSTTSSTDC